MVMGMRYARCRSEIMQKNTKKSPTPKCERSSPGIIQIPCIVPVKSSEFEAVKYQNCIWKYVFNVVGSYHTGGALAACLL